MTGPANVPVLPPVKGASIVPAFDSSYEGTHRYLIDAVTLIGRSAFDGIALTTIQENGSPFEAISGDHGISAYAYPGACGFLVTRITKYVADTWFHVSPISASGQMPVVAIPIDQAMLETRHQVGSFCVTPAVQRDSRGLLLPQVHGEWLPHVALKSLGDVVEPYVRYWHELEEILAQLRVRRGSDSQEHFMFNTIAPFIIKHGAAAIRDIDVSLETMPSSARFSFPYLLGHLRTDEQSILRARLTYLSKYANSGDFDIREGALEALDHLNAA